ncbi:TlpA family protein disulfide reductase [Nonomuraea sp. LPB2021202275-12-8]|uniref:TlpA family protein disulfide reductase n=1 Tax=Nonomuraea sp. LPB2021202275-12-8 TaxID=3120159 RepID=UPI003FA5C15B
MTGLWVVLATLALGSLIGALRLRRDGRMRDFGRGARRRAGPGSAEAAADRPAGAPAGRDDREVDDVAGRLTGSELGTPLGERATLVQFSTAFCQPCRATRRVLADVSELVPGVAHVEVDAESRLDLVRRLDVLRTPTVFVLDSSGNIVKRASGQPRKADVLNALAQAVPGGSSQNVSHESDEM